MSGGEPDGDWSSETPEVIDWGTTDLERQCAASGEANFTIPDDMWDPPDVNGTTAPATDEPPPEHRPDLYVVPPLPPPILVRRSDPPRARGHLDPAALDALAEMDGEPRPDTPAPPPRRQWRPGRSR